MRDSLGVMVIDNKPGAGGNLGADLAAKAAPDGQVDFSFDNLASAASNIRAGKLKDQVVTTVAEAGAVIGLDQFDIYTGGSDPWGQRRLTWSALGLKAANRPHK